jgi:tetratricopeptide (TPR) repeat protein
MLLRVLLIAGASLPILSETPGSLHPLEQALSFFNTGKYEECLTIVLPYVQQNPGSSAGHKLLGMDQYMLGRPSEAIAEVRRATELAPGDPDAFYYLGRLYFSTDNPVDALIAFQRAIELDASSVRTHNQLGQTLEALGRNNEAEREYLSAIELQQNSLKKSEWPYYNLGLFYFHFGRMDEAVPYLRKALICKSDFPEAKVKLAAIISKQNPDEAMRLLQQALNTDPVNAEGHYRLGQLLQQQGRREEAQQHFALFNQYRKR